MRDVWYNPDDGTRASVDVMGRHCHDDGTVCTNDLAPGQKRLLQGQTPFRLGAAEGSNGMVNINVGVLSGKARSRIALLISARTAPMLLDNTGTLFGIWKIARLTLRT